VPHKITIIGIGDDGFEGLTSSAQRLLREADVVMGSETVLRLVPDARAEKVRLTSDLEAAARRLEDRGEQRVVLLAAGDPLFYGVARFLCDRVGREEFDVVPHVSSMQLAFARVKESWEEAYLTNLATQPLDAVIERARTAEKVGLFTTEKCPPRTVAQALLDRRIDYFTAYVCENLGLPDERVTHADLPHVAESEFSPLNVMILVRRPDVPDRPTEMKGRRLFGNPDEMFLQSKPKRGLLTPSEVRTIALAELDLGERSIVWDVGAGSGSVAIEAALIAHDGKVFAIEMDPEDHGLISENAERFGVGNLVPILGKAPEAWADLPPPDCIFVGGTGKTVGQLVEGAYEQLKPGGRLVANVGSIENLAGVTAMLDAKTGGQAQIRMINIAVGTHQLERIRFEARNPTFILGAVKPA